MESLIPTRTPAYFQLNSFEFSDDTRHVLLMDIMRSFRPRWRFVFPSTRPVEHLCRAGSNGWRPSLDAGSLTSLESAKSFSHDRGAERDVYP